MDEDATHTVVPVIPRTRETLVPGARRVDTAGAPTLVLPLAVGAATSIMDPRLAVLRRGAQLPRLGTPAVGTLGNEADLTSQVTANGMRLLLVTIRIATRPLEGV